MYPMCDCEHNKASPKHRRNESFDSEQPFENDPSLSLIGATGAFKFFDPTSALFSWSGWRPSHHDHSTPDHSYVTEHLSSIEVRQQRWGEDEGEPNGRLPARLKDEALGFIWRSRDNRKGRHALALRLGENGQKQPYGSLEPTNSLPATLRGIYALFTRFPYWDISWCVAIVYTLGSMVWVVNGLISVLPLVGQYSTEDLESANTWTAFAGALIFFLGSYLLFLEAINVNRTGCFGWAVELTIKGGRPYAEVHAGDCGHRYHEQHKHLHQDEKHEADERSDDTQQFCAEVDGYEGQDGALVTEDDEKNYPHAYRWLWWPSWRDIRITFLYQIGFVACAIQLVSGLFFLLSKFTTLPGITEHVSQAVLDITSWAPQIIGCIGFIAASLLFMLETQPKWTLPAPGVLGWHVSFWKLLGCIGFLLSAVFGPLGQHGLQFAERESSISIFWGSWAILLGSLVQWYESLAKYPVVQEGTHQYSEWNKKFIKEREEHGGEKEG